MATVKGVYELLKKKKSAETSCEEFNRLLDRGVLIDKQIGFFNG